MKQSLRKFNRYMGKEATDIWARELLNGRFDHDDMNEPMTKQEFLERYEQFYEEDQ